MDFTLVTIAHAFDLPLLKLQARSLNRYLARDFVREIIVVDNSVGASLDRAALLPQYGNLPVRIIEASAITSRPETHGWLAQQVYKLMISRHVWTKNYLLLDAKTHLIAPLTQSMVQAPDGRLRIGQQCYFRHPLQRYLLRCCDYFNIDKSIVNGFLPTVTPFALRTSLVRQLLIYMERNGQPFTQTFLAARVTEFFLFGTYLLHLGHRIEDHYEFVPWINEGMWKSHTNEEMQQKIARPRCVLNVHRWTFRNMNETTQHMLAMLWYERRLFASYADAIRFVRGCAITYR